MPDIEMPDGDIVNFPDDMPPEQIKGLIASKFPQVAQQRESGAAIPTSTLGQDIGDVYSGVEQGVTLGFGDEIQAAIGAGVAAPFVEDRTYGELYKDALGTARGKFEEARERSPYLTGAGEVGGAMLTGGAGAARFLPQGAKAYVATRPVKGGAALGALSGGVYGAGTGEGGAIERGKTAAEYGLYGLGGGAGGAALVGRAKNILTRKRDAKKGLKTTGPDVLEEVAERSEEIIPVEGGEKALGKVAKSLRQDLGADYENVLGAYKKGDVSLAELNQSRTRTLAQGAAQYPGGKARAQEFFDPKIAGSYERVMKNVRENVSGVESYHTTVDDLLLAGRAKAAPLYKKAYESVVDIDPATLPKEMQTAIVKARRQFPSELDGFEDNTVKVLDYAKRVLDDDISAAQRAGKGNLARSRVDVRNALLEKIDAQAPSYKEARAVAGDYLSTNNAMELGRNALKTDSELLAKQFKTLTESEKQAYQLGLGKAIRDEVGKVAEGANPYRRILGSPEKRKRIGSILSPVQFKKLEAGLRAEDRLFKMRNEVLGGSPTAGKLEAKNLISSTAQGVDDIMQVPRKTMVQGLKMFFDGLDDKTASKVSEILYETDPIKKLEILNGLKATKSFTPKEASFIKKTYFDAADKFDVLRAGASIGGGATPAIIGEE